MQDASITSLVHQRILCSEWVPPEWESKQRIKTCENQASKTVQKRYNQMSMDFDAGCDFDGHFHWRKWCYGLQTYILATSNSLKLKHLNNRCVSYKHAAFSFTILLGLRVDYCDVFLSCFDSHFDGTHSPQRTHWWASDAMLHFSKSNEETNSSTSWMPLVNFQLIFIFGWSIPLRLCSIQKKTTAHHTSVQHFYQTTLKSNCRS